MMKKGLLLLFGCLFFGLVACSNETEPQTSKAGEISGSLHFYTSQPDEDADRLVQAFNKRYPDVEVQVFRSGTEEVVSKLRAEKQAGSVQADVLMVADAVTFESLKELDLLQAYDSPEASGLPEAFVDREKMYYGTKVMATILAINTDQVTDTPDTWQVLTAEENKGKGIMPSPLYSGAAAYNASVWSRQDDFGWEFYEDLKQNETTVVQGNGGVLQAVASGEKAYGIVVDFIVARAKTEGSPVELIYPQEGVPVITEPIGMMRDSDNLPAAQAFLDFVLSAEGQELAAELGYTPIREGVQTPEGLKGLDEIEILSEDTQTLLDSREADKKKFQQIFGE
jgi:iron(III) transport system substrate-binding protein